MLCLSADVGLVVEAAEEQDETDDVEEHNKVEPVWEGAVCEEVV